MNHILSYEELKIAYQQIKYYSETKTLECLILQEECENLRKENKDLKNDLNKDTNKFLKRSISH